MAILLYNEFVPKVGGQRLYLRKMQFSGTYRYQTPAIGQTKYRKRSYERHIS